MRKLTPHQAITFIKEGIGRATLVGKSNTFMYKFDHPANNNCVWVSTDTEYIGYIPNGRIEMAQGHKGKPDHPAYIALDWYLRKAFTNPEIAAQARFEVQDNEDVQLPKLPETNEGDRQKSRRRVSIAR